MPLTLFLRESKQTLVVKDKPIDELIRAMEGDKKWNRVMLFSSLTGRVVGVRPADIGWFQELTEAEIEESKKRREEMEKAAAAQGRVVRSMGPVPRIPHG